MVFYMRFFRFSSIEFSIMFSIIYAIFNGLNCLGDDNAALFFTDLDAWEECRILFDRSLEDGNRKAG